MAYDPNDPADVAIVNGLVATAVAAEAARLAEEHETDKAGLVAKNRQVEEKLRKLRAEGGSDNTIEIERLENELNDVQAKLRKAESELRTATRDLATVTTERDTANADLTNEREISRTEFATNRLTEELSAVNVGSHFLPDLTPSMARQVVVKDVNGERQAFVGDKPLSEHIKEWAASDRAKHYITAPANGGGGSNHNNTPPPSGGKKISEMNLGERTAHYNALGKVAFEAQVAAEEAAAKAKT